jgi:hypothetical protein
LEDLLKKLPRPRLSYANVIATLALFLALGGVSYAAVVVPKNSVGTEQLKKNSVATGKVKDGAITGPKIDLSSLGTVPSASRADTAGKAETATKAETAGKAESATNASHADSADSATTATNADSATNAANANEASHAATADSASEAAHATDADELGGVPADQYLTSDSILPSGGTEVGVFIAAASNGSQAVFAINFHLRLPGGVQDDHVKRIGAGDPLSAECPGQGEAAPGYFCFYETWNYNLEFEAFISPLGANPVGPEGTIIYWKSHHAEGNARGSWAYTAA